MSKMHLSVLALILAAVYGSGCGQAGAQASVDEKTVQGLNTKTFLDQNGNIQVSLASDGKSTIVAVPKTATLTRQNELGDDQYSCLKACKDIADLETRLNCILKCPSHLQYQVFIFGQ